MYDARDCLVAIDIAVRALDKSFDTLPRVGNYRQDSEETHDTLSALKRRLEATLLADQSKPRESL